MNELLDFIAYMLSPSSRGWKSWISLPQCIKGQWGWGIQFAAASVTLCFNQMDKEEPLADAQTDWNFREEEEK